MSVRRISNLFFAKSEPPSAENLVLNLILHLGQRWFRSSETWGAKFIRRRSAPAFHGHAVLAAGGHAEGAMVAAQIAV